MKDEDDCDLDPESSVADLLLDEGKAARDGSDQKKIVKVIQEQGRAIREGSVVPDLSSARYQALPKRPDLPPVPIFPGAEKRNADELVEDARPPKRRRLEQIEEGQEEVVQSIEGRRSPSVFDLRGAHFLSDIDRGVVEAIEPKNESPVNKRAWVNTTPATRDELEELPRQPEDWQVAQRAAAQEEHRNGNRNQRRQTQTVSGQRTPASMLNGMKSASPSARQSNSSSAKKFKRPRSSMYDMPESEIEDSQMPRTVFTPKLVSKSTNRESTEQIPSRVRSKSDAMRQSIADDDNESKQSTKRKSRAQRRSREATTTSRSSSVASAVAQRNESARKRVKPTKIGEAGADLDQDEEGTTDSVSAQMQDELVRHSSPEKQRARTKTKAATSDWSRNTSAITPEQDRDVERSPESVSDVEIPTKASARKKTQTPARAAAGGTPSTTVRCWTCWVKSARCDNAQPKCVYCAKWSKNCQIYALTKPQFEQEKAQRAAGTSRATKAEGSATVARTRKRKSESLIAPTNDDATSEEETTTRASNSRTKASTRAAPKITSVKGKKPLKERSPLPEEVEEEEEEGEEEEEEDQEDEESQEEDAAARDSLRVDGAVDEPTRAEGSRIASASRASSTSNSLSSESGEQSDDSSDGEASASDEEPEPEGSPIVPPELAAARNTNEANEASVALNQGTTSEESEEDEEKGDEEPETATHTKGSAPAQNSDVRTPQVVVEEPATVSTNSAKKNDHQTPSSQVTKSARVLPAGMTEQEYDDFLKRHAHMTEEQRKANNLARQKGRGRTSTPLVPRSQSSQTGDQTNTNKKQTPSLQKTSSILSADRAPSSTQGSIKNIPATQPTRNTTVNVATTPQPASTSAAPPKSAPPKPQQPVQPTATSKLKLLPSHPTKATTAAAMSDTHQNPPYKAPGRKSLPAATTANAPPKSMAELKARMKGQSSSGSGASTPQSGLTGLAAKISRVGSVLRNGVQKKGFNMPEASDEDESEDEEESEEEVEKKSAVKNGGNQVPVVVQQSAEDEEAASETDESSDGE